MVTSIAGHSKKREALAPVFYRDFRWNWLATLLTVGATQFWRYAQGWHVLELTDSALWVGIASFASQIPILFLALVAGVVSDRVPRKRLLLVANGGFLLLLCLLALLSLTEVVAAWQIIIVALVGASFFAFYLPAHHAIIADILPKDLIFRGMALTAAGIYLAYIALLLPLGWILERIGAGGSYLVAGSFLLVSILALLRLRRPSTPQSVERRSVAQEFRQMVAYVKSQKRLVLYVASAGVPSVSGYMFALVLLPVFVKDVFHAPAPVLGYLVAAVGFGSMLGAAGLSPLSGFKKKGLLHLIALFLVGATASFFGLSSHEALSIFLIVLLGVAIGFFNALNPMVAMSMGPEAFRGRSLGLYHLFFVGMSPLGSLLAGSLAEWIGPQQTVFLGGAATMAVALAVGTLVPAFRRIE